MVRWRWILVIAAMSAAGGALVWAAVRDDAPATEEPTARRAEILHAPAPAGAAAESQLAMLREALAAEVAARRTLAEEVDQLRGELEFWASLAFERDSPAAEPSAPSGEAGAKAWFDEQGLIARGLSTDEAGRLRERFDENEMAELYLRDRAVREGWQGTPRYWRALREERAALRDDVGDDAYDLLLYAAGRNNRVVLSGVLQNSPAAAAGLRPDDVVLRYDGRSIFSPHELRILTTTGKAGAATAVDVRREGEEVRLYVPRGPLGVQLRPARRAPRNA